jgi:hypothetical protein
MVSTDLNGFSCKIQGAQRSRGWGGRAAVRFPAVPSRRLSWSEMAQERAGIHVKEADGDDDAGLVRIIHRDIDVFRLVLRPVDEPGTNRGVIPQGLTALRGWLMTRGPVGIPQAARARRRQMAFGNAERRIPMRGEVPVIAVRLPGFSLRPVQPSSRFPIHIWGMKPTVPTALSGPASPSVCAEVTGGVRYAT